jgi:hypothetical protein
MIFHEQMLSRHELPVVTPKMLRRSIVIEQDKE